ncbi:hypothetical protein CKO42_23370 [Lamprobacter modestohalophilus]|uniref:Uncharacterized protein n=1 Tax=Lamprobacter modestohalophilus TaxID=1064514 RepID=A0A9X1B706_9GAMM|nr:hypothetical protein [Lamprobacter modestohalophilus]
MQSAKTAEADTQASTSAPGRAAESPWVIPGRGWWQIARRVGRRFMNENLGLVAAGVGFYSLLALFPAIVALVTLRRGLFEPVLGDLLQARAPRASTLIARSNLNPGHGLSLQVDPAGTERHKHPAALQLAQDVRSPWRPRLDSQAGSSLLRRVQRAYQ